MEKRAQGPKHSRRSGVLLHITSLPCRFGIGDLGPAAYEFVDQLAGAKQTWWQLLPLGPPASGGCPYQCYSAMAGNPDLISPELLRADRLLKRNELRDVNFPSGRVDFDRAAIFKRSLLTHAFERFNNGAAKNLKPAFAQFRHEQADWLHDFSLFLALKEAHRMAHWARWSRDLAFRKRSAMSEARKALAGAMGHHEFAQFLFFRQLDALRKYAAAAGIRFIGDLPIFVSGDSADVWSHPQLFQLDRDRRPKFVAGVPPDYFSSTGQRWGNPLYNWNAMKTEGFHWWIERARMALRQADLVRIDHFRGMAACWTIPASQPTAERGRWVKSPGVELFNALQAALGRLPFIAEDLGVITPDLEALRDRFDLPGMRVLQFAFGGDADNPFLPHHYVENSVAYTGTHDNDTTVGWYKSLDKNTRQHVRGYIGHKVEDPAAALMRLAWSSVADIAIAPLQDVLSLGSQARMNTPGTITGNWAWRLDPKLLTQKRMDKLRELTELYGRSNS